MSPASAEGLIDEAESRGRGIGAGRDWGLCHGDPASDMGKTLCGKPGRKPGIDCCIDPQKLPGAPGDEVGDKGFGIVEAGGDDGTDDLAAAESPKRGEAANAAVPAHHRK